MSRIGFLTMPWSGHLNPFAALALEIKARGYEVLFFHLPEFADEFGSRGLPFRDYATERFPAHTFARRARELSRLKGEESVAQALETTRMWGEALLQEGHEVLAHSDIDLFVIDHLDYAASILVRKLGIPFVSVITTLMRHSEEGVPGFTGEPHVEKPAGESAQQKLASLVQPWRSFLNNQSLEAGLGPFSYDTVWSSLAQITQQPAEFEYPRKSLPNCFHFTGPFLRREAREKVDFPWSRLTGQPLIYASIGSVSQGNIAILQNVIEAVSQLDVQLVVSAGGYGNQLRAGPRTIVQTRVPQLELLDRTDLMVHHAGMNSTLECLSAGVPMVVCPLANDQPGIAKRIEWSGTGVALWPGADDVEGFRLAVASVLSDGEMRQRAERYKQIIAERRGLERAADIILEVARTGESVVSA